MKGFTKEDLAKGTGEGGSPALVAVDGKVFDVSKSALWKGGKHMNTHAAGRDLSREIKAAPHGPEVLGRVEEAGTLAEAAAPAAARPATPVWAAAILSRHPHPVSVHFPIALSVAGALFTAIGIALGNDVVESAGLFNLAFGAVAAPAAIAAGLLSWRYNYGGVMTGTFRTKIALSVLYLAIAGSALVLRLHVPSAAEAGSPLHWIYAGLVLVLPLAAMALGYLGGTITFPAR
jgi:predicted heme/steroid binding protein/uncharacterized membrane protein